MTARSTYPIPSILVSEYDLIYQGPREGSNYRGHIVVGLTLSDVYPESQSIGIAVLHRNISFSDSTHECCKVANWRRGGTSAHQRL